jgi:uncharacterized repeat protein (TIGR03803 family)
MDTTKQHANSASGTSLRRLGNALVLILVLGTAVTLRAQSTDEPTVATYHLLYSFHNSPDGCVPFAGPLVQDASGNLYGTTYSGGAFGYGTVFKVTPGGTETVLHRFAGPPSDGGSPQFAGLTLDAAGNVYGTTRGGKFGYGVVFKVTATGTESILYNFTGGRDGSEPYGGLVRDSIGNLYGATSSGGTFSAGVVFKLTPSGTESVLHDFKYSSTDGAYPAGNLKQDSSGNLYGTTSSAGAFFAGTVFEVSPSGSERLLHSFKGYPVDGATGGGLLRDASGNLYGVTLYGGRTGDGIVFKLTTSLTESVLFNFNGGNSGGNPYYELTEDAAGNLYGATQDGGSGVGCPSEGCGLLFELSAGKEIVLHNFTISSSDGAYPYGGVHRDSSGNLYGVLDSGGAYGCGAVFKYTP